MNEAYFSDASDSEIERTVNVCIVEDDKYYCEFVRRLLASRRHPPFMLSHADTLREAQKYLQEENPDVILLDLNLPDSRGLNTLAEMKEFSAAPIIIITSSNDEALGLQSVTLGAQDYLVKQHVSKDSLIRSIRYAIERRKAEEQSLRLAAIKDFSATLAHDLRVPLIGAQNVVEGLLRGQLGQLSEKQIEALNVLKESTRSELQLVQRLLEIYRYEVDVSQFPMKALSVSHILEKFILANSVAFPELSLSIELPEECRAILGDEEALLSLLHSLVENAYKFGDGRPVTLRARAKNNFVFMGVHNWGSPISTDIMRNLFLRFWQGVPGKTYVARTGLGLYLCDRIAQLHQGRMICTSSPEDGTEIGLRLQAYRP